MKATDYEFFDDRLRRINRNFNIVTECENGYWVNFNKPGNMSSKRAFFHENPVTMLNECEHCGMWRQPRYASVRNDCWCAELNLRSPILCVSCWNTARSLVKKYRNLQEMLKITRQLKRIKA